MPAQVVFTFAKGSDKEAVQCPMAKGCVCAEVGGSRRAALVHPQRLECETTGIDEGRSQQEGVDGRGFVLFQVPDISSWWRQLRFQPPVPRSDAAFHAAWPGTNTWHVVETGH